MPLVIVAALLTFLPVRAAFAAGCTELGGVVVGTVVGTECQISSNVGNKSGTFNLDQSLLYVNDSPRKRIHVHDVQADGSVANARLFAMVPGDEPGVPDGMKIDLAGNVYCCGPGGIHVFMPDGKRIARIRFPEKACNFAFGGADHRTLYVTACTSVYSIMLRAAGLPQFSAS